MASTKGREASYKRHEIAVRVMSRRSTSRSTTRRHDAEQRRQASAMPKPLNQVEADLREYLVETLADPAFGQSRVFAIEWDDGFTWAPGPSITPHAQIFDRFVKGVWSVQVDTNINNNGVTGWVFTRL